MFVIRARPGRDAGRSYGIYGPAASWARPRRRARQRGVPRQREVPDPRTGPGTRPGSLKRADRPRSTALRREHPALQRSDNLRFQYAERRATLFYRKATPTGRLDPLTRYPYRWTAAGARGGQLRSHHAPSARSCTRTCQRRHRLGRAVPEHGSTCVELQVRTRARRRRAGRPGPAGESRSASSRCVGPSRLTSMLEQPARQRRDAGPEAPATAGRRSALVQGRDHLPAARPGLPGLERRRHRRLPRPRRERLDYLAGPGRHRHLAAAVLPVAAARRRLRHRRLHGRPSRLRHAARLPDLRRARRTRAGCGSSPSW